MVLVSLTALALMATPVLAVGPGGGPKGGGGGGGTGGGGGGGAVPEINANGATATLTLLGGITLILTDRLRRRQLAQANA